MDDLREKLARLADLSAGQLDAKWRQHFRTEPPSDFSRDLILRAIAHRLQEQSLGGLAPKHCKLLDRMAQGGGEPVRALKVGTMMVREFQGVLHEVVVVPGGFHWQGRVHSSLSTIARAITGTAWNGPRFFGLRGRRAPSPTPSAVTASVVLEPNHHAPRRTARRSTVHPKQEATLADTASTPVHTPACGDRA